MPNTTLGFPYSSLTDAPNGPVQEQSLAEAIDAYMQANYYPKCGYSLSGTTGHSVASATQYAIAAWDATEYDAGGITYAAGILTVPVAGLYHWDGTTEWANPGATYQRGMYIKVNGAIPATQAGRNDFHVEPESSTAQFLSSGGAIALDAGDALQAWLYHTGAGQTVTPFAFSLYRVA